MFAEGFYTDLIRVKSGSGFKFLAGSGFNENGSKTLPVAGLWIRIHFLQIRIQLFFSMRTRVRIQIQLLF